MRRDLSRRMRLYFGVTVGFGFVSFISYHSGVPILIAPLAASTCILFAAPGSPFARPRNVIFGHALSAAIGVISNHSLGENWLANTVCVAFAVAMMDATDTMHPPAAATSLLAFTTDQGYMFIFRPVALGACILVLASELVRFSIRNKDDE
ncbi:HPP family protein [Synergistaceae bacterium OttesenSCG-928-I11]|nr:HPP family protein [Synergistaceae bacterium OttesenSCG-928-I11]